MVVHTWAGFRLATFMSKEDNVLDRKKKMFRNQRYFISPFPSLKGRR